MQQRPPRIVLVEIFGDTLRKQDMTSIAAIHHALCDIDPGAGDIGPSRHVNKSADGTAVYAHPQLQFGVVLERAADFRRTLHWPFRAGVKNQRHAVARRNLY